MGYVVYDIYSSCYNCPMTWPAVSRRKLLLIALALVVVLAALALGNYLRTSRPLAIGFSDDYLLLPDKVSQSAAW